MFCFIRQYREDKLFYFVYNAQITSFSFVVFYFFIPFFMFLIIDFNSKNNVIM